MNIQRIVSETILVRNMQRIIFAFTFFICLLSGAFTYAQDSLRISVRANVKKDFIQLRWVVNTPLAWKQTNRNGFLVERYTVVRNNVIVTPAEKITLTPVPLKAQPLDQWQSLATSNSYAAVIAQALYGEDFQLSGDDAKGVSKMMALAQELEQRYLVSMYAADLCYPAAVLAGWGIEDRNVKPGERYLYRIKAAPAPKAMRVGEGSVYVTLNDYQPLPEPQQLTAIFGDKNVILSWDYKTLSGIYNSYFLEKSLDGKIFSKMSDTPYTNMNSKKGRANDRMIFMDTLADNNKTAYYRIIGVSSFGEEGPPSAVVSGKGENKLIYVPHIESIIPEKDESVVIKWSFDERGNKDIKHFQLQRADTDRGPFVPVVNNIDAALRTIKYDGLLSSNYFVIAAIPQHGEPVISFPVLVQPSDTIPPLVPKGLVGIVDSLGVVKLTWNPNTDKDILGYRIYRGQTKGEELIPLTDNAVLSNYYYDTVDVKNLNSKAYYAVSALDKRYNQSDKSAVAELLKPEMVPPSPPIFTNYKLTGDGVLLEWVTGEEENLNSVKLYRLERGAKEQETLKVITDLSIKSFTDQTAEAGRYYSYSVQSITAGGLASDPSPVVTIQAGGKAAGGSFENFTAKHNKKKNSVVISWKHNLTDVKELTLYKGENENSVTLWKVLKGFEMQAEDVEVKNNVDYVYIIRATLANGKTGATAKVKIQN
jgi:uncharacterized protein